jgi:WD40 repeat protein
VVGDLREGELQCEYAIKVLNRATCPLLAVGNHSTRQSLRLIPQLRWSTVSPNWYSNISDTITLAGGHGEDIVRDVLVSDDLGAVFTCGEDGSVRLWVDSKSDRDSQSMKRKYGHGDQAADKRRKSHSRHNP